MPKRLFLKLLSTGKLVLCLQLLAIPVVSAEVDPLSTRIQDLDTEFRELSSEFYRSNPSGNKKIFIKIEPLYNEFKQLVSTENFTDAIRLLYSNIETLKENIDHPHIFKITDLLLKQNEWGLAKLLFNLVEDENDQFLSASMRLIFSGYHSHRKEWKEISRLLENSITELSSEKASLSYLLYGTSLQHLKQHRRAAEIYSKIPSSSPLYLYAQLNSAIANIRQGWLAEAQSKIKNSIAIAQQGENEEIIQRLYLIMGYAFLQNEYYRDARESFRQIRQHSQYENRALLGIGLTATSQGDFVGGLNALATLKDKQTYDLPVDESYLIIPYIYEKLQNEAIISASYSEAMDHYQKQIETLDELMALDFSFNNIFFNETSNTIQVQNISLEYAKHYPGYFIYNYRILQSFMEPRPSPKLKKKINRLKGAYEKIFRQVMTDLIGQRKKFLNSYLNQSRYGLARRYDSNKDVEN